MPSTSQGSYEAADWQISAYLTGEWTIFLDLCKFEEKIGEGGSIRQ